MQNTNLILSLSWLKIFCGFLFLQYSVHFLACHSNFPIWPLPVCWVLSQTSFFLNLGPTHSEILTVSWIHHDFSTLSVWTHHPEDFFFCPPIDGLILLCPQHCAWHPINNCWMKCSINKTKTWYIPGNQTLDDFHTWVCVICLYNWILWCGHYIRRALGRCDKQLVRG